MYLYSAKHHFSSEIDNEYNNITPIEDSYIELAQPPQSMCYVLAQVVVADSCCCRAFNGSDFLQPQGSQD
jgi:hypothetical protein